MTKAHQISSRKANILKLGRPPKTERRLVNLPLAGIASNKRSSMQGSSNTPLTKRLEAGSAVMQKWPKIGRRLLRDDQCAVASARRESSNRRLDGTQRRADPVVLISPVLSQGVNAAAAGEGKFRVKPWNLCIVMGRRPINCLRVSFGVHNYSKYRRIDGPVIFVNKGC